MATIGPHNTSVGSSTGTTEVDCQNLLRYRPWRVFLLTFIFAGLVPLGISLWEGSLIDGQSHSPYVTYHFLGTFFIWPFTFLIWAPFLNVLIFAFYRSVLRAVQVAQKERALIDRRDNNLLAEYIARAHSVYKVAIALVMALVLTYLFWEVLGIREKALDLGTWQAGPYNGVSATFYAAVVIWFVEAFLLANVAIDFGIWCAFLRRVAAPDSPMQLRPILLHRDGAAGFSLFGWTALFGYLIIFMLAIFLAVQIAEKFYYHLYVQGQSDLGFATLYDQWMPTVVSFLGVLAVLPLAFYMPIRPLMQILTRARKALLDKHQATVGLKSGDLVDSIGQAEDPDRIREHYQALLQLQTGLQIARQMPRLPFDDQTGFSFVTTYLVPMAGTGFGVIKYFMG